MACTEPILEEALFGWLWGLARFEEFSQHLVQVITVNHHHYHHHHHFIHCNIRLHPLNYALFFFLNTQVNNIHIYLICIFFCVCKMKSNIIQKQKPINQFWLPHISRKCNFLYFCGRTQVASMAITTETKRPCDPHIIEREEINVKERLETRQAKRHDAAIGYVTCKTHWIWKREKVAIKFHLFHSW